MNSFAKLLIKFSAFWKKIVIVPPNCTDRLQPLDISVNKAAKEFLRSCFQEWYASKIAFQLKPSARVTEPVDLRLSLMKPIGAKWLIELYDYLKSKPEIICNGLKGAGITSAGICTLA